MAATDGTSSADNHAAGSNNTADIPHSIAQSHITPLSTTAAEAGTASNIPLDPASKYPDLPPSHAVLLASLPLTPPPLPPPPPSPSPSFDASTIEYVSYSSEHQLPYIQSLIDRDLSEPYSIYTYRYFINNWPHLALLALVHLPTTSDTNSQPAEAAASATSTYCVGTIICKLSPPAQPTSPTSLSRGYLAMLATHHSYRHMGIAWQLVQHVMAVMERDGADVVVLETEVSNVAALALYERLHFVRDCRLPRYYLNGGDAYRLKRWMTGREERERRAEREHKRLEERETRRRRKLLGEKTEEAVQADSVQPTAEQLDRLSVEQDLYGQQQEDSDDEV